MGLISSRLNLDGLHPSRRRSQQEETMYSYSLNKNYFSNYFIMGGERFEVQDPDYLFGDNCDLNFLSCIKPYSLPYKNAQQNLLNNLNTKQKAINKVSSRNNRFTTSLNILTGRNVARTANANTRNKQDAQTQTQNCSRRITNGSEPSRPLVMCLNIRKETLRLVKRSLAYTLDSDQNSLTNTSIVQATTKNHSIKSHSSKQPTTSSPPKGQSAASCSRATTAAVSITPNNKKHNNNTDSEATDSTDSKTASNQDQKRFDYDTTSLISAASSNPSGYTSVKDDVIVSESGSRYVDDEDEDDDDEFKDALNDDIELSFRAADGDEDDEDDDNNGETQTLNRQRRQGSTRNQDTSSLAARSRRGLAAATTQQHVAADENRDVKITINLNECDNNNGSQISHHPAHIDDTRSINDCVEDSDANSVVYSTPSQGKMHPPGSGADSSNNTKGSDQQSASSPASGTRVYNIEFEFDAEVDCSIRIFYFCTREVTSQGIGYKPQHATYKSKVYFYKKGMNQKFNQQEHTFQPYLFDEDLLMYKPLDMEGNYNSGAVFPIVIHCVALEGPTPRQSQSLVATVEKSQLDDSYSIKPLKQLIFIDRVQYILQDIYGIEHKPLIGQTSSGNEAGNSKSSTIGSTRRLSNKSYSLQSNLNSSHVNLSDTVSMTSVDFGLSSIRGLNRGSLISNSNQQRSLMGDSTFECVVCMSDERDTMLLPCRHLCLCSSCAQSLRYQASSCPICRCPFKAALNLRPVQRQYYSCSSISGKQQQQPSTASGGPGAGEDKLDKRKQQQQASTVTPSSSAGPKQQRAMDKKLAAGAAVEQNPAGAELRYESELDGSARRCSVSSSATPLLSRPEGANGAAEPAAAPTQPSRAKHRAPQQVGPVGSTAMPRSCSSKSASSRRCDGAPVAGPTELGEGSVELQSLNVQWSAKGRSA